MGAVSPCRPRGGSNAGPGAHRGIDGAASDDWLDLFSPSLRARLVGRLRFRDLRKGQAVFRAGDPPDGLYGLLRGQVRLVLHFSSGHAHLNHVAERGDWFGEISTLDGRPRLNDAICARPSRIAHLPQADAELLMSGDAEFLRTMARLAARHHRAAVAFACRTMTLPVGAQVAYALLSLARKARRQGAPAVLAIRQEDLASMVGASRQTVAVQLRRMSDRGVVALGYGSITIRDLPALATEACIDPGNVDNA